MRKNCWFDLNNNKVIYVPDGKEHSYVFNNIPKAYKKGMVRISFLFEGLLSICSENLNEDIFNKISYFISHSDLYDDINKFKWEVNSLNDFFYIDNFYECTYKDIRMASFIYKTLAHK